MITTSSGRLSASFLKSAAYSRASAGLWMEQGPTMTTILSEVPARTSATAVRAVEMTSLLFQERGSSARRTASEGQLAGWKVEELMRTGGGDERVNLRRSES